MKTPSGPARLYVDGDGPVRLVLGHGAGGGIEAPDLLAARAAACDLGLQVVRVEQPWRVRGARVAETPARLDAAWLAALAALPPLPCVLGGRSSGARVACRTAGRVAGVRGVLCLAFPLVPPGRTTDRSAELALPTVPRLIVQGERDAFGRPSPGEGVRVHLVPAADHAFAVRRRDGRTVEQVHEQVRGVVRAWLAELLAAFVGDAQPLPAQTLTAQTLTAQPPPVPPLPAQTLT